MKGFSLIEVLVAMALMAVSALGLAELFSLSSRVTLESRVDTIATLAAETKMAELRALTWTYDLGGTPVSDAGLSMSPMSSLNTNVAGFSDYLDASGRVVSVSAQPPNNGVYVRRWNIQPLPADPANALVLQVMAARVTRPQSPDARLVSILARTSQ